MLKECITSLGPPQIKACKTREGDSSQAETRPLDSLRRTPRTGASSAGHPPLGPHWTVTPEPGLGCGGVYATANACGPATASPQPWHPGTVGWTGTGTHLHHPAQSSACFSAPSQASHSGTSGCTGTGTHWHQFAQRPSAYISSPSRPRLELCSLQPAQSGTRGWTGTGIHLHQGSHVPLFAPGEARRRAGSRVSMLCPLESFPSALRGVQHAKGRKR